MILELPLFYNWLQWACYEFTISRWFFEILTFKLLFIKFFYDMAKSIDDLISTQTIVEVNGPSAAEIVISL